MYEFAPGGVDLGDYRVSWANSAPVMTLIWKVRIDDLVSKIAEGTLSGPLIN